MSRFSEVHGLAVGDEIDYRAFGGHWCAARVEAIENNGSILQVRFAAGEVDITSRLDLKHAGEQQRIAPVGASFAQ